MRSSRPSSRPPIRNCEAKPVAVGGERRGIIASASYEARTLGIYTPMPTARARKLCPRLIVIPGDFEKYEQFSRFMFSYAYDFTPEVEIASIDEGYFDLSGQRQHTPRAVAEIMRETRQKLMRRRTVARCIMLESKTSKFKFEFAPPSNLVSRSNCGFVPPGRDFRRRGKVKIAASLLRMGLVQSRQRPNALNHVEFATVARQPVADLRQGKIGRIRWHDDQSFPAGRRVPRWARRSGKAARTNGHILRHSLRKR